MLTLRGVLGDPHELLREPMRRAWLRSRVLTPYWRRRFGSFGEGAVMDWPAWLYGPRHIAIGAGAIVLRDVWLAAERSAWGEPDPVLRIGRGVLVSPWSRLSATAGIDVGDHVVLAARVSIVDTNHTHAPPGADPGAHRSVLYGDVDAAPISIGEGTWVGDGAVVLAGARIGRHCTIGANSVVAGEIPDFSVAVGAPARVVGQVAP